MADRALRDNESLNGGRTVMVGDVAIERITSYDVTVENVYDDNFSFTASDGTEHKTFLGVRKKLSIKTGWLYPDEYNTLVAALSVGVAKVTAEEFGSSAVDCNISDISTTLDKSDFSGEFYYVSFSASETGLTVPEGL